MDATSRPAGDRGALRRIRRRRHRNDTPSASECIQRAQRVVRDVCGADRDARLRRARSTTRRKVSPQDEPPELFRQRHCAPSVAHARNVRVSHPRDVSRPKQPLSTATSTGTKGTSSSSTQRISPRPTSSISTHPTSYRFRPSAARRGPVQSATGFTSRLSPSAFQGTRPAGTSPEAQPHAQATCPRDSFPPLLVGIECTHRSESAALNQRAPRRRIVRAGMSPCC